MDTPRVQSKHLFSFQPRGQVDQDILAKMEAMKEMFGDPKDMQATIAAYSESELTAFLRGMMEAMLSQGFTHPCLEEAHGACEQGNLTVDTEHDGKYGVKVLVHTPKAMVGATNRPAIVYSHGGGCVGGSADLYSKYLSYMAVDCGVIVFNVDYRLAPETKAPNNVLDYYQVIRYVSSHAVELGVDPGRICMAGESGGGYICAGAMVKLAQEGESHLVKLAIPIIPMLTDYSWSDPAAMTKEEEEQAVGMRRIWTLIAGGKERLETMKSDPLLFPGKADAATLAKMPPTIVWENELDFYITEATRFAGRLRAAGRLLELVVIPGTQHGSGMMPEFGCFRVEREAYRLAIQEYLVR